MAAAEERRRVPARNAPAAATNCGNPTCRGLLGRTNPQEIPAPDHVHFYGYYIGNYPTLERGKILRLCELLNDLARGKNRG